MFKKSIIAAATVVATAGSAFAMEAPSQGAAMLAQLAGVEPGVYAVNDLIRLNDAQEDSNSASEVAFILDEGRNGIAGRANTAAGTFSTGAGADQLANAAGVASGEYSIAEVILLNDAIDNNETEYTAFILDGGLRNETGSTVSASPARQQLAGPLNVNAEDFTLAQLVQLDAAVSDNNRSTIGKILDDAGVDMTVAQILR